MIDLTGANLAAYMIRVAQDIVVRNPRFRNTLGQTTFASNSQVFWNDTQITIKDIASDGSRLSFDYFICTQHGRAILAKVGDKQGAFVEWVVENDKTRQTPPAGTYYFNVDAVDEQTRNVNLTVQQYRWAQGSVKNAEGTTIILAPTRSVDGVKIDGNTLTATDATAAGVNTVPFEHFLYLTSPCQELILTAPGPVALVPNVDFWIARKSSAVVVRSTVGGDELANIPPTLRPYTVVTFFDQDGYELRKGVDYTFQGLDWISLSPLTPPGSTITAVATVLFNPALTIPATNPENIIHVEVGANESLATGQVLIAATSGDYNNAMVGTDGNVTLPVLLLPGENLRWEARILTRNYTVVGKKYELNRFFETVWDPKAGAKDANTPAPGAYVVKLDPATGQPVADPLPGMAVAIGDNVVVGDQVAIIVNPDLTETYEVFGSKETVTFTIECKSNDFQTSSDLSEMLKHELDVQRRTNMEADGITVFGCASSNLGEQRDPSGTAPRYIFNLAVTTMCDWKDFVPCITRMASYEVLESATLADFSGKISFPTRRQQLGAFQFLPAYA